MARKGLLIEYQYCTGCHSCDVACKQEHNYPVGKGGLLIQEIYTQLPDMARTDYIPFPTEYCDLCGSRTSKGEKPACVKACQAATMWFGNLVELAKLMEEKPHSVLFTPR